MLNIGSSIINALERRTIVDPLPFLARIRGVLRVGVVHADCRDSELNNLEVVMEFISMWERDWCMRGNGSAGSWPLTRSQPMERSDSTISFQNQFLA